MDCLNYLQSERAYPFTRRRFGALGGAARLAMSGELPGYVETNEAALLLSDSIEGSVIKLGLGLMRAATRLANRPDKVAKMGGAITSQLLPLIVSFDHCIDAIEWL